MKKSSYLCKICGCDVEECAGWGLRPSKNPYRFTFHPPDEANIHICKECIITIGKAAEALTRGISHVHPPEQHKRNRFSVGQVVKEKRTGLLMTILSYNEGYPGSGYQYRLSKSEGWYDENELVETMREKEQG